MLTGSATDSGEEREFFEGLGDFRLSAVFDAPGDPTALIALLGKFDDDVDLKVEDLLAELGTAECLEHLSARSYRPEGWAKVYVLRNAFQLSRWTPGLVEMIMSASDGLPGYTLPEGQAFALLALHKAGVLGMAELLARFPKKFDATYRDEDHRQLATYLMQLRDKATPSVRRGLSRLVSSLSRESEE